MTARISFNIDKSIAVLEGLNRGLTNCIQDPVMRALIPQYEKHVKTELSLIAQQGGISDDKLEEVKRISAQFQEKIARWKNEQKNPPLSWSAWTLSYLPPPITALFGTPPQPTFHDFSSNRFRTAQASYMFNCLSKIVEKEIATVGLYRISGSTNQIKNGMTALKQNPGIYEDQQPNFDIHTFAGLVKALFREMETPLLEPQRNALMNAVQESNPEQKKALLSAAIKNLPPENQKLLSLLLTHLRTVAANSTINKMDASNLATCFTTNLFALSDLTETGVQTALLTFLIENSDI